MDYQKGLIHKIWVIGIITLLFSLSILPIVESFSIQKQVNYESHLVVNSIKNDSGISLITLKVEGLTGGDNWYGTDNRFTFTYESNEIKEIYYAVDGNWSLYTGTFSVLDGGNHVLEWYAVDNNGNQSEIDGPFFFKVDRTKPEIEIEYYEITGGSFQSGFELTFTINASDSMIGMDRVEIYLGNVLQKIDKGPGPIYKWILPNYNSKIKIIIYAIAFDKAGNSAMDSLIPTMPGGFQNHFYKIVSSEIVEIKNNKVAESKIVEIKNIKVAEKSPSATSVSSDFDPASVTVVFNREFGENNWINSNASISIFYESDRINEVFYQINDGGWKVYTEPLIISDDGVYVFSWYAVDSEGYTSTPESIFFKIDKTSPEINLKTEKVSKNEVKIIAEVADATSGIDRVEFQNMYGWVFTDYEYPYEWIWTGFLNQRLYVTVYDKAGNSASSSTSTQKSLSIQQSISQQINQLLKNIILHQYL